MKQNKTVQYLFLVPGLILFALIFGFSIILLVSTSLTDWTIGSDRVFVGLKNYINLMHETSFLSSLKNTIIWIVLQSTVHVAIGTSVALILMRKKFYWKFVRTVYMIPNIVSAAAVGMMFSIILNPEFGAVNNFLKIFLGHDFSQNWFMDKSTAFGSVTFTWLPYAATITILVLAEISAIDSSIYEAAKLDGVTGFQEVIYITLPLLKNIIGTCAILGGTSMLQKLDIIMMTTQGGPRDTTMNLPYYIYKTALTNNDFGMANASGVYLIILGSITVFAINKLFHIGKDKG
ncbi:MAG: sugar ABC transporter permease [Sphaerochaetaceae bacterium]|nr:sugar ABC transporter permease [Sphaerochaetaceae bacterium]